MNCENPNCVKHRFESYEFYDIDKSAIARKINELATFPDIAELTQIVFTPFSTILAVKHHYIRLAI